MLAPAFSCLVVARSKLHSLMNRLITLTVGGLHNQKKEANEQS